MAIQLTITGENVADIMAQLAVLVPRADELAAPPASAPQEPASEAPKPPRKGRVAKAKDAPEAPVERQEAPAPDAGSTDVEPEEAAEAAAKAEDSPPVTDVAAVRGRFAALAAEDYDAALALLEGLGVKTFTEAVNAGLVGELADRLPE